MFDFRSSCLSLLGPRLWLSRASLSQRFLSVTCVVIFGSVIESSLKPDADVTQVSNVTTSDHPPAAMSTAAQHISSTWTRVDQLPFYHQRPLVPIPPGLQPLPSFPRTKFPRLPSEILGSSSVKSWYLSTVGINPGLHRATWEEYRADIEAHRGLPEPYCPVYHRVNGPLPSQLTQLVVLPPPPRPEVRIHGSYYWVVYAGRVPGIYDDMCVVSSTYLLTVIAD